MGRVVFDDINIVDRNDFGHRSDSPSNKHKVLRGEQEH